MSLRPDPGLVDRARTLGAAVAVGGDLGEVLALARELSPTAQRLGSDSAPYLTALLSVGAGDLTVARVVEPHLDAVAILAQSAAAQDERRRGRRRVGRVRRRGASHHLAGTPDEHGTWTLTGRKPWCSLASEVSHAVITAHTGPGTRRAFAVDLGHRASRTPSSGGSRAG
ncbi:hypothetical protein [Janibacter melonis]|uniref:hypothetical protein n=1 Tax=Janibacter melonis TaxID=262209 RepID=UPI0020949531|nr:hypothetical protein [Janibacter melonis]